MEKLSVAIIGAGALGSAIGGTLAEKGATVFLVSSNQEHRDAINRYGLQLTADAVRFRTVDVPAYRSGADIPEQVDIAIILVHSAGTANAARDTLQVLKPAGTAFSLQNGLGQEEILAAILGKDRVMGGKTYAGGTLIAPGKVQATIEGKLTVIGELDGAPSPRAADIAMRMTHFGVQTEVAPDIWTAIWDKLLINVATGALSSITRMPYGELYAHDGLAEIAFAAVGEAMAVARAEGVSLTVGSPEQAWHMARAGLPDNFRTSMLQTILKGRKSEIDFINGAVVRKGVRLGVPTPVNATLVACVRGIESSRAFMPAAAANRQEMA